MAQKNAVLQARAIYRLFAVLLGLALLLVPPTQAYLVPQFEFEVEIPPLSIAAKEEQGEIVPSFNFTLITGSYLGAGALTGAYAILNGIEGSLISNTTRIDVINTRDQSGAANRFLQGQCASVEECAVERSFLQGTFQLATNSSFLLYTQEIPVVHALSSSFAIGVFLNASAALQEGALGRVPINHSLVLVGDAVRLQGRLQNETSEFYAILANQNATVVVRDGQGSAPQSYTGTDYLFRFHGAPNLDLAGQGVMAPFRNGTEGVFRRASIAEQESGFQPARLNVIAQALGGRDILPGPIAEGLRGLGPILNGVLVGRAEDPIVEGESLNSTALGIIRFGRGELAPRNESAVLTAETEFILLGNQGFYSNEEGVEVGFLRLPPVSILLWVVAAGAIVAGFALRPMLASSQAGAFGGVRLLGWLFHLCAFAISFILWDQEFKNFLGTSFLTIWVESAFGRGGVLFITAFLEILGFLLAGLLFGMPIRFIVNSGLKLGGLKKARGVGKGVGNLATWGLGAPFIPFVLNGFVGTIVDALQRSIGG